MRELDVIGSLGEKNNKSLSLGELLKAELGRVATFFRKDERAIRKQRNSRRVEEVTHQEDVDGSHEMSDRRRRAQQ